MSKICEYMSSPVITVSPRSYAKDAIDEMVVSAGLEVKHLKVDGGASVNNLLMQIQSDLLGEEVVRPMITETTALGAALLAGLAVGFWKDLEDIKSRWKTDRTFSPEALANQDELIHYWNKALERTKDWIDN